MLQQNVEEQKLSFVYYLQCHHMTELVKTKIFHLRTTYGNLILSNKSWITEHPANQLQPDIL